MKPQEINERIAKLLGKDDLYFVMKRGLYYRPNAKGYTSNEREAWRLPLEQAKLHEYPHDEPVTIQKCSQTPDYCNSLDACREFEDAMDEKTRTEYLSHLDYVCGAEAAIASAHRRCVTFLRMKGQLDSTASPQTTPQPVSP